MGGGRLRKGRLGQIVVDKLYPQETVGIRKYGRGCKGMGEDTKAWARMQRYGGGYKGMGEDAKAWARMQRHGRGYKGMGEDAQA